MLGLAILSGVVIVAAMAPVLFPGNPFRRVDRPFQPPFGQHVFGTDVLGLGDPNVMSWGFMIGAGRTFLRTAWWLCTIPGVAILLTVLAINLVGEGLNDALNPRLRR
jgi:ABC-type dipeptide/oligopeptide/nickel transport system permease subunit